MPPPPPHPKSPHLDPPPPPTDPPDRPPPPMPPPPPPSPPPPPLQCPPPSPWGPSAHFYWGGSRVQKRGDGPPVLHCYWLIMCKQHSCIFCRIPFCGYMSRLNVQFVIS